jgi:hypothetical protein
MSSLNFPFDDPRRRRRVHLRNLNQFSSFVFVPLIVHMTGPTGSIPLIVFTSASASDVPLSCMSTQECRTAVHPLSECQRIDKTTFTNRYVDYYNISTMYCTNPFASGCFHALDPEWDVRRTCNSEDSDQDIASGDVCRVPTDLQYMEMRLFTFNWESVHLENWLLQIILSEFLDVPTSLETGVPGSQMNFYHPFRVKDGGSNLDRRSLGIAADYGDCLKIPEDKRAPDAPLHNLTGDNTYQPCAHMATEIWSVEDARNMARDDGIIEAPQGLGVLGEEGWFVPQFTAKKDPSLLSYLGLQGPVNQRKLADMFLRPTTWAHYCQQVSKNNCSNPDEIATRPPVDDWESGRYFTEDEVYTGYFRSTNENDCDLFPSNCTGHIADYPCGWTSYVTSQTHYLGIAVASSGPEPGSKGYAYDSLVEIWHAANWTKSDVIFYWWTPDALVDLFEGTDAEFTRISLPKPTQQCEGK